jgi:hypothetical protein
MEHVGGLRHARDEIAVGNHNWRVCGVGIGEELDSGSIGILGSPELDGIIGALGDDAVCVGDLFESTDVGLRRKSRIFVADQSIERMYARHGLPSLVSFPSAVHFKTYLWAEISIPHLAAFQSDRDNRIIDNLLCVYPDEVIAIRGPALRRKRG